LAPSGGLDNIFRENREVVSGTFLTWLDGVTVCDPACGSGAFLIAAYDWFLDHRLSLLDDLSHVEPGDEECAGSHDDWIERSAPLILQNNLYGVDISPESVEIAQLSLWIRTARPGQPLTDLSAHIRCGNSVVDDPLVDPKAFDWKPPIPERLRAGRIRRGRRQSTAVKIIGGMSAPR